MWGILRELAFMALGGFLVHLSWLHAWRMHKRGKNEGQDMAQGVRVGANRVVK